MSQKTILQSIFGDQTNIKRGTQPPGGASSIVFGAGSLKSEAVKGKNRQVSDIFNLDENKEVTKKRGHFQQEDTKSRLFGGDSVKTAKADEAHKIAGCNPITGEVPQGVAVEEDETRKDAETVSNTTASSATANTGAAAAGMPSRIRQPPGGTSTKLW